MGVNGGIILERPFSVSRADPSVEASALQPAEALDVGHAPSQAEPGRAAAHEHERRYAQSTWPRTVPAAHAAQSLWTH
jgi:hypothetical protein